MITQIKITHEEEKQAIELYEAGKSQREIAEELGRSQSSISQILIRNNIETRVGKKVKYTDINIAFFREINSEESAYFLGFMYADGCVQTKNRQYMATLKLKSNDQVILERFRDIMSPSSPILSDRSQDQAIFRTNQKVICEQLIELGCVPNKSLILEFPTKVPNELIRHFLRGYSDGDGSIYSTRYQKSPIHKLRIDYYWAITSTKQFCQATAQLLKEKLGVNCSRTLSHPKLNQTTTALIVSGNLQSMKVLNWLYQDATIYLPRKHEKYLEFQRYVKERKQG
jgi:transcriptional regulator with XRE-family HTH domain